MEAASDSTSEPGSGNHLETVSENIWSALWRTSPGDTLESALENALENALECAASFQGSFVSRPFLQLHFAEPLEKSFLP